jgi:hypothetical protein
MIGDIYRDTQTDGSNGSGIEKLIGQIHRYKDSMVIA